MHVLFWVCVGGSEQLCRIPFCPLSHGFRDRTQDIKPIQKTPLFLEAQSLPENSGSGPGRAGTLTPPSNLWVQDMILFEI